MYLLRKAWNPQIFQGKYKRKNYFEGWYFKVIDMQMSNNLAVIPGVSLDKHRKDCHAFVQIIDAHTCKVNYFRYDMSSFWFNTDKFEVKIGNSYFSGSEMLLSLSNEELNVNGHLRFRNIVEYPKTILRPGIMGPFTFVPFMECYHGIVNIHHDISGQLSIQGDRIDFNNGYGYIEKDWGRSFPETWIWFQSNHFNMQDVSLMFSVAKIPWLGRSFLGFLSFLRIKDKIYHFSTYTGAKIKKLSYHQNILEVVVSDNKLKMEISVRNSDGGVLKAPKNGLMDREISESITATVKVRLSNYADTTIYEGEGTNTGLEIVGDIIKLYS